MAELLAERVRVSDLRGGAAPAVHAAVLEDPTGRRRRRLRFASRAIALTLTLWLVALVLGGVGLNPVPGVPFLHILRPATPPPAAKKLPEPAEPTASELQPALRVGSKPTAVAPQPIQVAGQGPSPTATHRTSGRQRALAVHTTPPAVDGAPSTTAPGKTTHPNNGKGSGGTSTTTTTTTTTTTPGHSGTAPGQTGTTPGRSRTTPVIP